MAVGILGVEAGASETAGTTVTPDVDSNAGVGDDVWCHIMFANVDADITEANDWTVVETVEGPTYVSVLLHHTLTADDNLAVTWTGSSHYTWHTVAVEDAHAEEPQAGVTSVASLGSAVLGRLTGLPSRDDTHMIYFAGSVNVNGAVVTSALPDVGWLRTLDVENPEEPHRPVCWVGDADGPLGDTDATLTAAVNMNPPPTHSVGWTVAVEAA